MGGRGSSSGGAAAGGSGKAVSTATVEAGEQQKLDVKKEERISANDEPQFEKEGLVVYSMYHPTRGDYVQLIIDRPSGKWYVAKLEGTDPKYGFKRNFLERSQPFIILKSGFYEVETGRGKVYFEYKDGRIKKMEKDQVRSSIEG